MERVSESCVHIDGEDRGRIMLYALSTCQWCRKTKELLLDLGVAFDYLYLDELDEAEMETIYKKLTELNPRGSLPTLVVNEAVIVGFHEDLIREAVLR